MYNGSLEISLQVSLADPVPTGKILTGSCRYHCGSSRCPSEYGIRCFGSAPRRVRSLLVFHGSFDLLVFRYFQGHYDRCKSPICEKLRTLLTCHKPVAVMSTVTGNVVSKVALSDPSIPGHVVASALAVIAGSIICFIGLIRAGWIVDFISLTAISAFMTGSAINIAVGQVPTLMGITGFSTRGATYHVVINTLKHLNRTKLDAAMGLTALAMLYILRSACNFGARRLPNRRKMFFFLATLRTVFVILLYTLISWLVNRHHREKHLFKILGKVPRGVITRCCY